MSIIAGASYYIKVCENDNQKVLIYNVSGDLLQELQLEKSEYIYSSVARIDRMLDPACVNLARPAGVVIGYHIKLGRTISFIDKNDKVIECQCYNGPSDLEGLVDCQKNGPDHEYSYKLDYDWMLEHKIPVIDKYEAERPRLCDII